MTLQQNGCFRPGTIQHEFLHILGKYSKYIHKEKSLKRLIFILLVNK
jgi:hypothetical protein